MLCLLPTRTTTESLRNISMEDVSANNEGKSSSGDDYRQQQEEAALSMFLLTSNGCYLPQQPSEETFEPTPIHPHGANVYVLPNVSVFDDPQLLHATNDMDMNFLLNNTVPPNSNVAAGIVPNRISSFSRDPSSYHRNLDASSSSSLFRPPAAALNCTDATSTSPDDATSMDLLKGFYGDESNTEDTEIMNNTIVTGMGMHRTTTALESSAAVSASASSPRSNAETSFTSSSNNSSSNKKQDTRPLLEGGSCYMNNDAILQLGQEVDFAHHTQARRRFSRNDSTTTTTATMATASRLPSEGGGGGGGGGGGEESLRGQQESQWMARFKELEEFKSIYGHCSVQNTTGNKKSRKRGGSMPDEGEDGNRSWKRLYAWVRTQRYQYKLRQKGRAAGGGGPNAPSLSSSSLTDARIRQLDGIGFIWDSHSATWMEHFEELKEYHKVHGHSNVPVNYEPNPQLSMWVKSQRRMYKKLMLSRPQQQQQQNAAVAAAATTSTDQVIEDSTAILSTNERIRLLDTLDFDWDPRHLWLDRHGDRKQGGSKPKK